MKVAFLFFLFAAVALAKKDRLVFGNRTAENVPSDWALTGDVDKDVVIPFIIALKQQNLDVLEEQFWDVANPDSPNYRSFLTIDEINQIVAPEHHVVKKVIKWVKKHTMPSMIEERGDSIYFKSTVKHVRKLFNTDFKLFTHVESGATLIRQVGEFSVPHHLAHHVDFVAGLSEFPTPRFNVLSSPLASVSVAPQTIQTIYLTGSEHVTGNSSAGVIEFEQQSFSPSDLQDFASKFHVDIPALKANHIVGNNNPSFPQIEATLDIQYILGVGVDAEGWFWLEDNGVWLYGFASHMFSTKNVPQVNSISYGWNEESQCQNGIGGAECQRLGVNSKQYVQRTNTEFQKLGLRGVTLLAASGDSGANGRTDGECTQTHLNPAYPGASPYLTSVGATQISSATGKANLPNPPPGCAGRSCASSGTEECVSFAQSHFASGGGFSDIASTPAYQQAAVQKYLKSGVSLPPSGYFNSAGRGFPDVSAFGSQVLIVASGNIEGVGGTSASAPIFGGVLALLNQFANSKDGKSLGFVNPLLYKMAAEMPSTFTDVTVGDNKCTENGCRSSCKGFEAAKGWDPVSGLGTPVYTEMKKYLLSKIQK